MSAERRFSFVSMGLPADTFAVVSFTGVEALSRPYEFVVDLASNRSDIELEDLSEGLAVLTIMGKHGNRRYQGIVARFELLQAVDTVCFYRAVLVPRLWGLTLTRHNQIFLDKSAPEFLKELLTDSGILSSQDFEFRLSQSYPKREYVCQYGESHYNFLARWLEREGLYYFFEQQSRGEKLIITDSAMSHQPLPEQPPLRYDQIQALNAPGTEEFVFALVCEQHMVPKSVLVKDYNYRLPNVELKSQAEVPKGGYGEVYVYGDNVKSSDEAQHQAKVRAEQAKAGQRIVRGQSSSPMLCAGFTFSLENHFRSALNRDYLTVELRHEGNQTGYIASGLGVGLPGSKPEDFYRNSFTAIPSDVQYRHPRVTELPRFHGLISARVDAAGSGQYAELDDKGRYKVKLPFDLSDRDGGKASHWLRMAQPYGGSGHGMHFPLLKGSEVLVGFIDGDPDRPFIAHAVPNFEQTSIVHDANNPANAIRSVRGNQLVMGDKSGQEFIGLFSPFHKSGIAVGSMRAGGGGSLAFATEGDWDKFSAGAQNEATAGAKNEFTVGVSNEVYVGLKNELVAAISYSATLATQVEYVKGPQVGLGEEECNLKDTNETMGLTSLSLSGGVAAPLTTLITSAKKALAVGMLGTATAGAGIVGLSAPFDEGFLHDASVDWKHWSFGLGLTGAIAGTLMAVCSAAFVAKLVKKFEDASKNARTGEIVLDNQGVKASVNCTVSPTATFTAEVLTAPSCAALAKSTVQITALGGNITLTNKQNAVIDLAGGTSITLKVVSTAQPPQNIELVIDANGITLTKPNGGKITVGANGVVMESLGASPGKVTATASSAKLECGNDSIAVTPQGLQLQFTGHQLHAGQLRINEAGIIQLG